MKKILILAALTAAATAASAQSYIAGLNFTDISTGTSDVAFDKGSQADLFTLNIQTNAEDNGSVFGFTDTGWAALNDNFTDGTNNVSAGATTAFAVTVKEAFGFAPSSSLFGGTSAFAQGFSNNNGISFVKNTNGFFTIGLSQGIDNLVLGFDVAGVDIGNLLVNGQTVGVTTSAANQEVSLGNLGAGLITFDLTGLANGATFDNFMISGTVVPEPSTYAAIFGVVALGFAAYRRRRS
jgi:hypothetical protein